jgi:hypothetical protein
VGGYAHPLPVADHGLVREVHDDVHLVLGEGQGDRRDRVVAVDERQAVVRPLLELLRAAEKAAATPVASIDSWTLRMASRTTGG